MRARERVERAEGDAPGAVAEEPRRALAHLPRRLVGEGNRHDAAWGHADAVDEVGEPVDDDAGLAAARPRDHEDRALNRLDGGPLRGVQAFQVVHRGIVAHAASRLDSLASIDGRGLAQ